MTALPKPEPKPRVRKRIARGRPPAKKRKTTLGAAKRTLWSYFAAYVKQRDGNICFTCDKTADGAYLHAGHLFSRRISSTLYDPRNVHSQCASCNRGLRGNVPAYMLKFVQVYGQSELEALTRRAARMKLWTLPEILSLTAALRRSGADFELLYAENHLSTCYCGVPVEGYKPTWHEPCHSVPSGSYLAKLREEEQVR